MTAYLDNTKSKSEDNFTTFGIDECRRWIIENITMPPQPIAAARATTAICCSSNVVVIVAVGCGGRPRSRLSLACPP